ncbi:MAG: ABC transporter ATP-binding protein [Candidatus Marinimicrobia bacterium]|jgi:lipoprotein-releasing system ATP-binding protein|nr:ABC transporter ATP-binding protein [Candidatus Neomarinimicrobiota bacterium]MBT3633364.1 ABC transporter ATP-binding protein [Candidatus Neomarinimicrobiota bacterium]MBT3681507.1 ABC transporter ATP-binding protein [Candidatus Neomarinimicrobiota bacterium]MBT3758526.1 ABC transporter ATP-binding protein [Candidatus Neomarinimicrobiota bacterium]MBT3894820.1 ABC transporter ATP-binding protein [Candidatus Neomarinimicrobiota bacterium]
MILSAQNIKKTYKTGTESINVLDSLDFQISEKEIVVIMGPSGSGKSTLLHILGALDTPDEGEVFINGKLIDKEMDRSALRAKYMGFVFQHHHLLPEFTILENLIIPQLNIDISNEESIKRAMNLLEQINLVNLVDHYPNQVSGGERQRIAVLRALINNPKLVLADEPTGNLDAGNRQLLLDLMLKLRSEYNQSFVLATHDDKVAAIADRVLFLHGGKLTKYIED